MESSAEDMQAFIDAVNARRDEKLPELTNQLGWSRTSHSGANSQKSNRHVQKYEECGAQCLKDVEAYYSADFEHLQYPTMQQALANKRR